MLARQYAVVGRSLPFEAVGRVLRDGAGEGRAYLEEKLVAGGEGGGVGVGGVERGDAFEEAGVVGAEVGEVEELVGVVGVSMRGDGEGRGGSWDVPRS